MNISKNTPNHRPKTIFARLTLTKSGSIYINGVAVQNDINQHAMSINKARKRDLARDIRTAVRSGKLKVASKYSETEEVSS